MHKALIRGLLTVIAFFAVIRSAAADVTITGTVGEIGVLPAQNSNTGQYGWYGVIRFKLTDLNQTKACAQNAVPNAGPGYAWFWGAPLWTGATFQLIDPDYREWYAALLVSKKGATIACTIDTNTTCHVTSCTLP